MNRCRRTQTAGGGGEDGWAKRRGETSTCAACQGVSGGFTDGRGLYREVYAVLQIFDRADVHAA